MKIGRKIKDIIASALVLLGVLLMLFSFGPFTVSNDTQPVAKRVSSLVERRVVTLEHFMQEAMDGDHSSWLELDGLPDDMVIYRYCGDTLQSWCNEFPVYNDNLQYRVYAPLLTSSDYSLESPLAAIGETFSYVNLGSKWYLAKTMGSDGCMVIGGLEIADTRQVRGRSPVNPQLHVPSPLDVRPLAYDGGSPVTVMGQPQFKIVRESLVNSVQPLSYILWIGLALVCTGALLWLSVRRTLFRLRLVLLGLAAVLAGVYAAGWMISDQYVMFSPRLYAGGGILYSLGAVILINLAILMLATALYVARDAVCGLVRNRAAFRTAAALLVVSVAGIFAFTFFGLRSIIINSGLCLELYKLSEIDPFGIVVYISFIAMLMSVPLLLQTLKGPVYEYAGVKLDAFSQLNSIVYALLIAVYLVCTTGVLGFRKEQDRMEMLANRLAFDRDISLELYLRGIESQIADDPIIAALSAFDNASGMIQNRIVATFFSRRNMNYVVTAYVFNENNSSPRAAAQYNALVRGGQAVADNSRFLYVRRDNGRSYYVGVFMYLLEDGGISRVVLRLESRDMGSRRGYAGIFGISPPGRIALPEGFSFALYEDRELKESRGGYPYPTKLEEGEYAAVFSASSGHFIRNEFSHFVTRISEHESVVLSRAKIRRFDYFVSGMAIAVIVYLLLLSLGKVAGEEKERLFSKSHFSYRIKAILLISQICTLAGVLIISVVFIHSRNESNVHAAVSDKISSIIAMVEAEAGDAGSFSEMDRGRMLAMIRKVSDDTDSDISLYSPSGRVLATTTPFVFERMMLSGRISGEAYGRIMYDHQRYCILQERLGRESFYSMYGQILGDDGDIVAIVNSPYSEDSSEFRNDAISHLVTVISMFCLLLVVLRFLATAVVDKMFRPLNEMSRKMDNGGIDSMEPIDYEGKDDEISTIVQAYNSMVAKLSESSKQLAAAERDKAWAEMARQVAHEIKNPLTPMMLQVQRVQRLKAKGDPRWTEVFDEASAVLLEHIQLLATTAEDFSTFAKLYSETPVEVDLDRMLQDEVFMYDNRPNIKFDYLGLEGARVMAPKPQLTRVFINLLNNAVQAIGDMENGRIAVALRRSSTKDGYYDIVFEDNGPGVAEGDVQGLFTLNFTTKTSGSGIGLVVSRSILERSGATISYSRSFSLGGACFTICYPAFRPQDGADV